MSIALTSYWWNRYGVRAPTSRNIPGTRSIPKERYSEESKPELSIFKSVTLTQYAPNAERRNMEQINRQTNGEYGSFYKTAALSQKAQSAPNRIEDRNVSATQLPVESSAMRQESLPLSGGRHSGRDMEPAVSARTKYQIRTPPAPLSERSKLRVMLSELDSSFPRQRRADLIVASADKVDNFHTLKNYGISNEMCKQLGASWSNSLRKTGNNVSNSSLK